MKIPHAVGALVSILALVAASAPAVAQTLPEKKLGVYGLVTDAAGEPVAGLEVRLTKNVDRELRPLSVKTNKRGLFTYPRVEFFQEGYRMSLGSEEHFIQAFHLRTRRGTGEIWQDDEGKLTPKSQHLLPILRYRGSNATIRLTVGLVSEYAPVAAAPKPETPAAAPRPARRELTLAERADEALALGDRAAAADLLAQALDETPDDASLRWQRAEMLAASGETADALREARIVLEAEPDRPGVRLAMAEWMDASGQTAAALPLLEEQRALTPDDTGVLRLLVSAYEQAGRDADARSTLEAWAAAAPDDSEALLGLAGAAAKDGDFGRAEELYAKLAAADPENADTMYLNAGISILNRRSVSAADRERAVQAFRKCIEINDENARAHFELGLALLGSNDFPSARTHLARFVELAPNDSRAAQAKGILEALPR